MGPIPAVTVECPQNQKLISCLCCVMFHCPRQAEVGLQGILHWSHYETLRCTSGIVGALAE